MVVSAQGDRAGLRPADSRGGGRYASGVDLRISCSVLDPDWCAQKSESFADLIFEKTLVGKVELDGAVGEEHERRRGDRRLRHVQNLHALAHRDGGAVEVHALDEAVHLRGGYALAAFVGNFLDR